MRRERTGKGVLQLHPTNMHTLAQVSSALAQFAVAVQQSGQQFRAVGVWCKDQTPNIALAVNGVEPAGPFEKLRQALRVISGKADNEPKDGRLHVTLGWYCTWKPAAAHEAAVMESLKPGIAELSRVLANPTHSVPFEVPLALPHLTNYPDMASFPHNCP